MPLGTELTEGEGSALYLKRKLLVSVSTRELSLMEFVMQRIRRLPCFLPNAQLPTQDDHAEPTSAIILYYWDYLGRAGPIIHMLEYAKLPYLHVSDKEQVQALCACYDAESTTFAPPIMVHGNFRLSQSVACMLYIGRLAGLLEGIDQHIMVQYIMDIQDLFQSLAMAIMKGPTALKVHLEGSEQGQARFSKQMNHIERCINGPFFFSNLSVPDFYLCAAVDNYEFRLINKLHQMTGKNIWKPYPKFNGVVMTIRALSSYKDYKGGLNGFANHFVVADSFFDQWTSK